MDMIVGWYPIRNINFEPVVHFDFKKIKKVVHLIEFQTIKYNEQLGAKLQKNS